MSDSGNNMTVAEESIVLKLWIVLRSVAILTMYRLLAFLHKLHHTDRVWISMPILSHS